MTAIKRISNVIVSLITIGLGIFMMYDTGAGYELAGDILALSLILYGLRYIIYYFTLARHMVGGFATFMLGVIVLDFGIYTSTLLNNSTAYIVLYLLAGHAFLGVVSILRGFEAKKVGSRGWRTKLLYGFMNIVFAVSAFVSGAVFKSIKLLVILYCIGLICSALARLFNSLFRKTAVVYIEP